MCSHISIQPRAGSLCNIDRWQCVAQWSWGALLGAPIEHWPRQQRGRPSHSWNERTVKSTISTSVAWIWDALYLLGNPQLTDSQAGWTVNSLMKFIKRYRPWYLGFLALALTRTKWSVKGWIWNRKFAHLWDEFFGAGQLAPTNSARVDAITVWEMLLEQDSHPLVPELQNGLFLIVDQHKICKPPIKLAWRWN